MTVRGGVSTQLVDDHQPPDQQATPPIPVPKGRQRTGARASRSRYCRPCGTGLWGTLAIRGLKPTAKPCRPFGTEETGPEARYAQEKFEPLWTRAIDFGTLRVRRA